MDERGPSGLEHVVVERAPIAHQRARDGAITQAREIVDAQAAGLEEEPPQVRRQERRGILREQLGEAFVRLERPWPGPYQVSFRLGEDIRTVTAEDADEAYGRALLVTMTARTAVG